MGPYSSHRSSHCSSMQHHTMQHHTRSRKGQTRRITVSSKEEQVVALSEKSLLRRTTFHFVAAVSMAAAGMVSAVQAAVVSFGSGVNQISMAPCDW